MTSKQDDAPVSFTDTNAETGMTGKAASTSNMMDLVGQLEKSKDKTKDTSSGTGKKESKSGERGGGTKKTHIRQVLKSMKGCQIGQQAMASCDGCAQKASNTKK